MMELHIYYKSLIITLPNNVLIPSTGDGQVLACVPHDMWWSVIPYAL